MSVAEILDRALEGERISEDDAAALLRSRDLVSVGRAAHELRNRRSEPGVVTFIVDRNLNYSNICYTDCSFCAFYRRPGDDREGYVLPRPVIFKKIEETLALGGTAILMQGGHNPDLGIDWYEDLFRSIKARYPIHLHALSPSEIQHVARKARISSSEALARLRDAGLDSLPGGGAEVLVDRVRKIISPRKTTSGEWLSIMRAAHRLGMSTTATMMWGHVETLEERVEHLRRIRDLQDEMHGFRAFISWTYQPDNTALAPQVTWNPTSFDYLLMQGGHNPDLGIDWYEDLFREIKARYPIHLHALSPSEIQHVARKARLTSSEALARLRDAGLDSLPGGGAEVLVDRVRKIISPKKTTSDEWLSIMRAAHRLGMSTTATMMWGHVETLEERVEHLRRIRDLQDEMHGFRAFISWTYQPDNTALAPQVTWNPTSFDYLLMQAVTRIYLDNVEHIQSSWVTQGTKIGQVALGFGADDMGSIMIEENVVSAAGTTYRATTEDFVHYIRNAGFRPRQRDTLYRTVREYAAA